MRSNVGGNKAVYASLAVVCIILYMKANIFLVSVPLDATIRTTKSLEGIRMHNCKASSWLRVPERIEDFYLEANGVYTEQFKN